MKTMTMLEMAVKQAAQAAYADDAYQVVGLTDRGWTFAHCEDESAIAGMRARFRVGSDGEKRMYGIHYEMVEYSDDKGLHLALCVDFLELEKWGLKVGRDDTKIAELMHLFGAPEWVLNAKGFLGIGSWCLIGPLKDQ